MPLRHRRDRLIAFRVTDEERQRLQQACDRQQGRSLSDFARSVIMNAIASGEDAASAEQLIKRESRIDELELRPREAIRTKPDPQPGV